MKNAFFKLIENLFLINFKQLSKSGFYAYAHICC